MMAPFLCHWHIQHSTHLISFVIIINLISAAKMGGAGRSLVSVYVCFWFLVASPANLCAPLDNKFYIYVKQKQARAKRHIGLSICCLSHAVSRFPSLSSREPPTICHLFLNSPESFAFSALLARLLYKYIIHIPCIVVVSIPNHLLSNLFVLILYAKRHESPFQSGPGGDMCPCGLDTSIASLRPDICMLICSDSIG